ncbi:MAG: sigma-70 family RNA polymerase sigma factor [Lachnospiraceae bacterium]|jgi:RNA polymerase sigma-70 factor (ECF subfamily)|nr:sigma-70 family RNA polymerase sigma factor [Lachnospiraceae bacterium]
MTRQLFEAYFREQYSLVYRVAFMQMKRHADAEDAAQEVFMRLLKYQPQFENKEHEKAWFIKTTVNLCRDILKSKWNSTTVSIEKIPEQEKGYFHLPYMKEDETLWEVLALPEKYRDCLYFFYYEDYSIKEIAKLLGTPENTVKTNLKRGREALKKRLADEKNGE